MSDGLLDVDADAPPCLPLHLRMPVLGVRCTPQLAAYVREQAYQDGQSVNRWLTNLIEAHQDDALPADCRAWLRVQAGQCDCPGEPQVALVRVLRHLARRWPHGARLRS